MTSLTSTDKITTDNNGTEITEVHNIAKKSTERTRNGRSTEKIKGRNGGRRLDSPIGRRKVKEGK